MTPADEAITRVVQNATARWLERLPEKHREITASYFSDWKIIEGTVQAVGKTLPMIGGNVEAFCINMLHARIRAYGVALFDAVMNDAMPEPLKQSEAELRESIKECAQALNTISVALGSLFNATMNPSFSRETRQVAEAALSSLTTGIIDNLSLDTSSKVERPEPANISAAFRIEADRLRSLADEIAPKRGKASDARRMQLVADLSDIWESHTNSPARAHRDQDGICRANFYMFVCACWPIDWDELPSAQTIDRDANSRKGAFWS